MKEGAMCGKGQGTIAVWAQAVLPGFTVETYDKRHRGCGSDGPLDSIR
ncbi:hypothetical protein DSLASN_09450 [Desulfoluna limicola]|uniref:Uncharacterized protein n=1 Tax=Desulfoluna limicola TaxID=2810562 RepID=A0ABM7PE01_9BACT|nr:hypothetical protein DSLASN_09450 [Desulfoluna limicola]